MEKHKKLILIKKAHNNKLQIFASTWSEEFNLPDELYSISDIQDYLEYILKKCHSEMLIIHQSKYKKNM